MRIHFASRLLLAAVIAIAVNAAATAAGERSDIVFVNSLDEEIVSIRTVYATPYGEPRRDYSRAFLAPGGEYRIGVQGTTHPERIFVDLAEKLYIFQDLSALSPDNDMHLEVASENDRPILRRLDVSGSGKVAATSGAVVGLTGDNRPNAVDRDFLTSLTTLEEVAELVADATAEAREELGALRTFDIEAGPIWNHEHALERCPEAVEEWNEANDGKARWTGHWVTTVPGKMSVCRCTAGTADISETFFIIESEWSRGLYFPVFWKDWHGLGLAQAMDEDDPAQGVGFQLRFRLPSAVVDEGDDADESDAAEMIDDLLSDLRVDGFRPLRFQITAWDEEQEERLEEEIDFLTEEGDKYDHQDRLQELLFSAYAESILMEALVVWVPEEAFDKAKEGEEIPAGQGVMVIFSPGTFQALFVPDGRVMMQ